jgi:hypothetical protein
MTTLKPKRNELVVAFNGRGIVRVHRYGDRGSHSRVGYLGEDLGRDEWVATVCGESWVLGRDGRWSWTNYRNINPELVRLCKRGCWKEGK